jgi:hypothetical protein
MVVFSSARRKNYVKQIGKLSKTDRRWLGRILSGWLVLYRLITKCRPKKYAHEVLVKTSRSEKRLAFTRLLYGALGQDLGASPTTPGKLNKMLATWMGGGVVADLNSDMSTTLAAPLQFKRYITPSDMTWVLKKLGAVRVLAGTQGPKRYPGRSKASDRQPYERGGRSSYHKTAEDMRGLIKALSSPKMREIVYESLLDSGLLFKYVKFMKLAEFYAVREDPLSTLSIIRATGVKEVDEEKIRRYSESLKQLSSNELYMHAHTRARSKLREGNYRDDAYFLLGLFRDSL